LKPGGACHRPVLFMAASGLDGGLQRPAPDADSVLGRWAAAHQPDSRTLRRLRLRDLISLDLAIDSLPLAPSVRPSVRPVPLTLRAVRPPLPLSRRLGLPSPLARHPPPLARPFAPGRSRPKTSSPPWHLSLLSPQVPVPRSLGLPLSSPLPVQ